MNEDETDSRTRLLKAIETERNFLRGRVKAMETQIQALDDLKGYVDSLFGEGIGWEVPPVMEGKDTHRSTQGNEIRTNE
jgi:hypothetical protein